MKKSLLLGLVLLLSTATPTLAIKTDPVLTPNEVSGSARTAYDVNSGAAVTFARSVKGTVLVKIEGKIVAEIAPNKIQKFKGQTLNRKMTSGLSLNFLDKNKVIVFEY